MSDLLDLDGLHSLLTVFIIYVTKYSVLSLVL